MPAALNLIGKQYGRLTVIAKCDYKINKGSVWLCQCECGNTKEVAGKSLQAGTCRSCGCLKQESDRAPKGNVKDEIGNKYGHLTVIARAGSDNGGRALWECECDCPAHTHIIVTGDNLRRGHTQSCGCERRSHGEIKVASILSEFNIPYTQEYPAFKFANNTNAKFDFYVDNKYFIEYDGETHYSVNFHGWHTEERLKEQQERDMVKNQWCIDNHIPLIRIPYTQLENLDLTDLILETSTFIINPQDVNIEREIDI